MKALETVRPRSSLIAASLRFALLCLSGWNALLGSKRMMQLDIFQFQSLDRSRAQAHIFASSVWRRYILCGQTRTLDRNVRAKNASALFEASSVTSTKSIHYMAVNIDIFKVSAHYYDCTHNTRGIFFSAREKSISKKHASVVICGLDYYAANRNFLIHSIMLSRKWCGSGHFT